MALSDNPLACRLEAATCSYPIQRAACTALNGLLDIDVADPRWGANNLNNRWASLNTDINSASIPSLTEHCHVTYAQGGVSATPVISGNIVYYPTWNGLFVALDYTTCKVVWQTNVTAVISQYMTNDTVSTRICANSSRTSPQLDGDVLYYGTQRGALLVAADVKTGATRGVVKIHQHPAAIITQSPTLYNGTLYVGAASQEEIATQYIPSYECCSFIGNIAAYKFDHSTNKFTAVWNTNTLPLDEGWSGSAIWGSQPSIDPGRKQLYVATGNIYEFPAGFEKCENSTADCLPKDVYQDAILALDMEKGTIKWSNGFSPLDAWTSACKPPKSTTLCPQDPGPDADFGMAPVFIPGSLGDGTTGVDSVVAGQKSGIIYSLKADTGVLQWSVATSPDGDQGGISWGVAADNTSIYFTSINYGAEPWHLVPSGVALNNSAWGAMTIKTGQITWETQTPYNDFSYTPPTIVNDVVLVGAAGGKIGGRGKLIALAKGTGVSLLEIPVDSVLRGGIAVQDKYVMFGTGYSYGNPLNNGSFYVMSIK
ncbi:Quino protein alcohol dehydrogenase-like protein [Trichodelitschia bisporula]|uniref:Quino protein alcohol dehydrogenase-like protein n=1 Tax=Trichodelitschia bisporula TaxID=703511 RepID=A0A6G1I661_9PEZI|nr:Quino protein alcohol dehydrogenase-like protein [Trichodelitschia bisporula]